MVPVARVVVLPAGVSDPGRDDSVAVAQQLLDAPEAASGEDGGLCVVAHLALLAWQFCIRSSLNRSAAVALPQRERVLGLGLSRWVWVRGHPVIGDLVPNRCERRGRSGIER